MHASHPQSRPDREPGSGRAQSEGDGTDMKPELHIVEAGALAQFVPDRTAVLAASSCGVALDDKGWAVWRGWLDLGMPVRSAAHLPGCSCCAPNRALEAALGGLFADRIQGRCAAFSVAVVLGAAGSVGRLAAACRASALVSARYDCRSLPSALSMREG
jgi:hypothetical protein